MTWRCHTFVTVDGYLGDFMPLSSSSAFSCWKDNLGKSSWNLPSYNYRGEGLGVHTFPMVFPFNSLLWRYAQHLLTLPQLPTLDGRWSHPSTSGTVTLDPVPPPPTGGCQQLSHNGPLLPFLAPLVLPPGHTPPHDMRHRRWKLQFAKINKTLPIISGLYNYN